MELDDSELNYSRKICANEQVASIEDKRFFQIMTAGKHKNQLGNWGSPPPLDEVNLLAEKKVVLRQNSKRELHRFYAEDVRTSIRK